MDETGRIPAGAAHTPAAAALRPRCAAAIDSRGAGRAARGARQLYRAGNARLERARLRDRGRAQRLHHPRARLRRAEIGRASGRERGWSRGGAEDGIRVFHVTGVQTCALPICTRLLLLHFVLVALLPSTVVAQAAPLEGLDSYIERAMRDWNVPGFAIAVVRNDSIIHARGFGVR